jgi:hypothetical protein
VVKATYLREQSWYKPWSSRLGVLRETSHLSKEKIHAKKSRQRIAELINGCRQRRVKENKESKIKKLKVKNWTSCIQDRNKWKLYVEKGKNIQRMEVVAPKEEELKLILK